MFKIGCGERIWEVPLFVELYGYGPFAGRRNLGAADPLYVRAVSFNDGSRRALVIYTDVCNSKDKYVRMMRGELVGKLGVHPDGMAFVATHTHSAPFIGEESSSVGMGVPNSEAIANWRKAVLEASFEAVGHEEEIEGAYSGVVDVTNPVGVCRVDGVEGATDPVIRWLAFKRQDGSVKLLLHNHGAHGISMNGKTYRLISADWMGAVNARIKAEKLADMPLFFQNACGDINAAEVNSENGRDDSADILADRYMRDLRRGLATGGTRLEKLDISYDLKTFDFPVIRQDLAALQSDADAWVRFAHTHENPMAQDYYMQYSYRIHEKMELLKRGWEAMPLHDLQVIRLGDASFFFIPGEMFLEDGLRLLESSKAKFPFLAEVANGSGGYFPSERIMKKYPSIDALNSQEPIWGFYEVYCGVNGYGNRYQDNIADFINSNLLKIEEKIYG